MNGAACKALFMIELLVAFAVIWSALGVFLGEHGSAMGRGVNFGVVLVSGSFLLILGFLTEAGDGHQQYRQDVSTLNWMMQEAIKRSEAWVATAHVVVGIVSFSMPHPPFVLMVIQFTVSILSACVIIYFVALQKRIAHLREHGADDGIIYRPDPALMEYARRPWAR